MNRFADIPREPLALLVVTSDHRAYIDGTPLEVPAGTDPRVVAANAAVTRAQQLGRALRAVLDDADGQRWPMILTPEGGVFQSTRPLRDTPPSDPHSARHTPAVVEDTSEDSGPTPPPASTDQAAAPPGTDGPATVNGRPQPPTDPHETRLIRVRETDVRPPEDIDPSSVPAWPLVTIVLTEEGKAFVNDSPVNQPPGVEPQPDPADGGAPNGQKPTVPAQTTRPSKKEEAAERAAAVEAQERKNAGQAREQACARITSRKQLAPEMLRRVSSAAVSLGLDARALKLAHRWLRSASIGPELDDPHAFAAAALDAQDGLAQRLAYAMALAADELRVQRIKEWDAAAAAHLRRLMADAEHTPSDWERRQLEAAEGTSEDAAVASA